MTAAEPTSTLPRRFELGIHNFVDLIPDPASGQAISAEQRVRELVEQMRLADEVGLDVYGIGEHHRPDYLASSPATLLAAGAAVTKTIRLTSAVTVLGTDDPVRVFQEFATVDLLSGGRAEVMAGRGSFAESFPLFLGQQPFDYDALFSEKLDLLLRLREGTYVRWQGQSRPALTGQGVYPRPVQERLPVWLAVGGTPASAVRAGQLGLPMALAIIGGMPERFVGFADLYRQAAQAAGNLAQTRLSINSHGYVADSYDQAAREYLPWNAAVMNRIGRERGWPPITPEHMHGEAQLRGALFLGSPEQIAEKILFQHDLFGHDRFLLQTVGTLPHAQIMRNIELLGTKVATVVREEVARRRAGAKGLEVGA